MLSRNSVYDKHTVERAVDILKRTARYLKKINAQVERADVTEKKGHRRSSRNDAKNCTKPPRTATFEKNLRCRNCQLREVMSKWGFERA